MLPALVFMPTSRHGSRPLDAETAPAPKMIFAMKRGTL